jgi:hypothetical protein
MSATSESKAILTCRLCLHTFDQIESIASCVLPKMSIGVARYMRVVPNDDERFLNAEGSDQAYVSKLLHIAWDSGKPKIAIPAYK